MQLATGTTDYASGDLGLVELALSFLNDRQKKYFSEAEMKKYANLAQKDLAATITRYHKEYWLTYADTSVNGDQGYYSLPPDLVHIMGLNFLDDATDREHRKLVEVVFKNKDFYERLDKANAKNRVGFYFLAGTTFKLAPEIEAGTDPASGMLRIHYVRRITDLTDNTDESEIPEQHHQLISIQMSRYAYIKLNRNNSQLETMWSEGLERLMKEIRVRSPIRDEKVQPYYGTYGPSQDSTGRLHRRVT